MARYSSKPVTISRPASEIAAKFSDFTVLNERLEQMPEERRRAIGDVEFTADTICINTPQMGQIRLKAVERNDESTVLEAEGSPLQLQLIISYKPVDETHTEVEGAIDVEIPAMIRPMVGPPLQKAADKFGELFAELA